MNYVLKWPMSCRLHATKLNTVGEKQEKAHYCSKIEFPMISLGLESADLQILIKGISWKHTVGPWIKLIFFQMRSACNSR